MGDRRQEMGDRRWEMGNMRQQTGKERWEMGDRRQETRDGRLFYEVQCCGAVAWTFRLEPDPEQV